MWRRAKGNDNMIGCTKVVLVSASLSYASPLSGNNIPTVKPPPNHTSPPSMAATFLATCLMAVLQPSGFSIFHDGATPVSVSTLKSLLGVIGVLPLKPQASPILSVCI